MDKRTFVELWAEYIEARNRYMDSVANTLSSLLEAKKRMDDAARVYMNAVEEFNSSQLTDEGK